MPIPFRRLLASVLAALWCAVALPVAAAEPVALRKQGMVQDASIRLGDIFTGLDAAQAAKSVLPAPPPGQKLQLDAGLLQQLAQQNGLTWRPASRFDAVVLERAGVEIPREALTRSLLSALAGRGVAADGDVLLDNEALRLVVPTGVTPAVTVQDVTFDARQNRFVATVLVPSTTQAMAVQVGGRIVPTVEVPVPIRNIAAGDVVRPGDLELKKIKADQAKRGFALYSQNVAGKTARRPLVVGEPIRVSDLTTTMLVTKNSLVTVTVASGAMQLSMQAKALDDGGEGDVVRLVNPRSNKTIQGIVTGPAAVTVQAGGAVAAN